MIVRNPDHCPLHPGALLREEIIPATDWPKSKVASLLGISRQHLFDIIGEKEPVSAEVAVRLA
jgi:plasmid maintenance system antidote protein VapI